MLRRTVTDIVAIDARPVGHRLSFIVIIKVLDSLRILDDVVDDSVSNDGWKQLVLRESVRNLLAVSLDNFQILLFN